MHSFLYEIVARIVAICLCLYLFRELRNGLVERKIRYWNPDLLDWYSYGSVHRDVAPIRYWIEIGFRIFFLVTSVIVAIFGWWREVRHS